MFQQDRGSTHYGSSTNTGSTSGQRHSPSMPAATPPVRSASGRGFRRGSTWREANANGPRRRMEVAIPQKSLKVFAQAVQCLMKVCNLSTAGYLYLQEKETCTKDQEGTRERKTGRLARVTKGQRRVVFSLHVVALFEDGNRCSSVGTCNSQQRHVFS